MINLFLIHYIFILIILKFYKNYLRLIIFWVQYLFAGLILPENNSELNHLHVIFEWKQIPEAIGYELQVSENPSFSSIVVQVIDYSLIYIEKNDLEWDKTYHWRIRPLNVSNMTGDWSPAYNFSTGSPISGTTTTIIDENLIQDGITVFGAFFNYFSAAVDKTGKEIWNSGAENLVYYSTSESGDVFGCSLASGTENNLPGKEFTFRGETIWEEPNNEFLHHDLIQLPNGNYLGIIETSSLGHIPIGDWTYLFQGLGFQADGVTIEFPWIGDKLVEWDAETGDVVWEWNVFDHFNMIDFDQYGGTWNQAYVDLHYDWTHVNAVIFEESENAIYISTRHLSRITKIDYPSGSIIWNLGHDMPSGDVTFGTDIGFSFQHSVQILDNGNLLTFDNGNLSEIFRNTNDPQSRAIEISVNANNAELVWTYDLPNDLFGFASGNAQKLQNGNVLVTTIGGGGRSLEVNTNGQIVWEANYNLSLPNGAVYRAHRIPGLFPAAFSVIVSELTDFNGQSGVYLNPGSSLITFDLINEGPYEVEYQYTFTDQAGWFESSEEIITLSPDATQTLSFTGEIPESDDINNIELIITPIHHPENQKLIQIEGHSNLLGNEDGTITAVFQLYEPFPNPFNPVTTIQFDILEPQQRNSLEVFNISGQVIKSILNDKLSSNHYSYTWNAVNQPSGIYFIHLTCGNQSQTRKVILIK